MATYLTHALICREMIRILKQKLNFIGNINMKACKEYGKSGYMVNGSKIGPSVTIAKPAKYMTMDGPTLVDGNYQQINEASVTINRTTFKTTPVVYTQQDMTLSMPDFKRLVIDPATASHAAIVEAVAMQQLRKIPNRVGTFGTQPNTAKIFNQGRALLAQHLCPMDLRACITPDASVEVVEALASRFHSKQQLVDNFKQGMLNGEYAKTMYYENTLLPIQTNGNKVAGVTISAVGVEGAATLVFAGLAAADTFKAGQVFTIANVFEVHDQTKETTARLKQFCVAADATSAGATLSVTITEAMYASTTDGRKNISALPSAAAAVTFAGAASASHQDNIQFHRDAFAGSFVPLYKPNGVHMAERIDTGDGFSMLMVQAYTINDNQFKGRMDTLSGFATVYPEMAVRL